MLRPSHLAGQMLLMLAEQAVVKVVLRIRVILGSGFHFRTETLIISEQTNDSHIPLVFKSRTSKKVPEA